MREQGWRCSALIDRQGIELARAARVLVSDVCAVRPGESWTLTADGGSDAGVVMATAVAAYAAGARPLIVWDLGSDSRSATAVEAVSSTGVWVQFGGRQPAAARRPKHARSLCLRGLSGSAVSRLIGNVDIAAVQELETALERTVMNSKKVRVTSPAGCDASFECRPLTSRAPRTGCELAGLIRWAMTSQSVSGDIVVDGSLSETGVLTAPIWIRIERGQVVSCSGGEGARRLIEILRRPGTGSTPVTGVSAGFNPGARLSGMRIEDERVSGCIGWWLRVGGEENRTVIGISLDCSAWIDGQLFMDQGRIVYPGLEELIRACHW